MCDSGFGIIAEREKECSVGWEFGDPKTMNAYVYTAFA
jgi:hypothetical protein